MASILPALSELCGWIYFLLWSFSFYPQPILNIRNRSTAGLAFDFPLLNIIGFVCYTIGTAVFLYSPVIREQYAARHPASPEPTVRFNDLCFGINAVVLCTVTVSQFWPRIWGFKNAANRRANTVTWSIICASSLGLTTSIILVLASSWRDDTTGNEWQWIDVIYTLTFVKLAVTFFKYIPQIIVNHRRKSTVGWSIAQILLDFGGSLFSFLQLFIDCSLQADWSGLTGNPIKLGLANVSLLADIVFMTQHYVLYRHANKDHPKDHAGEVPTETDALLHG